MKQELDVLGLVIMYQTKLMYNEHV
uniref:Uncharacterized protein n=1 Tax=Rhizophora mucronata TaxID=61149 RepID=A0A2P2Q5M0_RHIMU